MVFGRLISDFFAFPTNSLLKYFLNITLDKINKYEFYNRIYCNITHERPIKLIVCVLTP